MDAFFSKTLHAISINLFIMGYEKWRHSFTLVYDERSGYRPCRARIDARNFSGHTALHVMVQRDRFECVVALLSCGADQNLVDSTGIF
jgi:hypothetical protein